MLRARPEEGKQGKPREEEQVHRDVEAWAQSQVPLVPKQEPTEVSPEELLLREEQAHREQLVELASPARAAALACRALEVVRDELVPGEYSW